MINGCENLSRIGTSLSGTRLEPDHTRLEQVAPDRSCKVAQTALNGTPRLGEQMSPLHRPITLAAVRRLIMMFQSLRNRGVKDVVLADRYSGYLE
jgi:hypothetical protein